MATEHKCEIIKLLKEDTDCPYTDCEAAYYKAIEYLRGFGGIKAKIDMSGDKLANEEHLIHLSEVAYDVNMREAYEAGYEKAKKDYERSQGEWVIDNWGMYHCNYCMKEKQQLFHNFCSFCGADMRGKKNETDN